MAYRVGEAHPHAVLTDEEVDLLLVHADGRAVPIEVKSANAVGPADAAGLSAFALKERDAPAIGVVVGTAAAL